MTSSINPSAIVANFPVAGINQSTQQFRTNYSIIQGLFSIAGTEISNLQSSLSAVLVSMQTLVPPVLMVNHLVGDVTLDISTINDVNLNISSLANNQALVWNGSHWTNSSTFSTVAFSGSYNDLTNQPAISGSLSGLTDIVISNPISNQVLMYNGTDWTNQSVFTLTSGIFTAATVTVNSNGIISAVSSTDLSGYLSINNIANVGLTNINNPIGVFKGISGSIAQFLSITGDGISVNTNLSSDGNTIILSAPSQFVSVSLAGLTDVSLSSSGISTGDVLSYNSTSMKWTNVTSSSGAISLTGSMVTTALGYTPFNAAAGGIIVGGVIFQNSVYATYGIAGNASSATRFQNTLNITYTNDVTGNLSFGGSEGSITCSLALTHLGVPNGIATLDSGGKLTNSQIPSALVGALVYQGTWDASTNSPTLTTGIGTKGNYYVISNAGTTTIDGNRQWNVGDTIIFNGTAWNKIDGIPNEVISVNGQTGAVVLTVSNISGAAPLASPALTGVPTAPTATTGTNTTQVATTEFVETAVSGAITTANLSQYETVTNAALKAPIASPTFTGIPAVPTASSQSTNTDQIANTNWVQWVLGNYAPLSTLTSFVNNFTYSTSATGWAIRVPTQGATFIIQCGIGSYAGANGSYQLISYPVSFPNAVVCVFGNIGWDNAGYVIGVQNASLSQFQVGFGSYDGSSSAGDYYSWIAIGY
jgi:hypothetical protein